MLVTEKLRLAPDQSAGPSLPPLWLSERTLLATVLRTGQGVRKSRLVRRKPGRSSDPSQLLAQSIRCPSSNTLPSSYSSNRDPGDRVYKLLCSPCVVWRDVSSAHPLA